MTDVLAFTSFTCAAGKHPRLGKDSGQVEERDCSGKLRLNGVRGFATSTAFGRGPGSKRGAERDFEVRRDDSFGWRRCED